MVIVESELQQATLEVSSRLDVEFSRVRNEVYCFLEDIRS